MRFIRSHGLGNDYLILESGEALPPALVRAVCDRHTGLGSDGILEPIPGREGVAFGVRIHNPDGSEAEKSGNGLRIYAHWRAGGIPSTFRVWTAGGVVGCQVQGDHVRVTMGVAHVGEAVDHGGHTFHPVDIGNPHHVCFEQPADWRALAAAVEHSVPGRTNVQFAHIDAPHRVHVSVWERGAGETRSSGSSACAVVAVAVARGLLRSPVTVEMAGGSLLVEVAEDGTVTMEGPVEPIAIVVVDERWLMRRTPRS